MTRTQLDPARWDACLDRAENGLIYARSWYLDLVSPGWEGWVQPAADGTYRCVVPVPVRRKWGLRYVAQPPMTQQLGWFGPPPTPQELRDLIRRLAASFRLVEYSLHDALPPPPTDAAWRVVPRATAHLSLQNDRESIRRGYARGKKSALRRAARADLRVVDAPGAMPKLIDLFRRERQVEHFSPANFEQLQRLSDEALRRGCAEVRVAVGPDGDLHAGSLFLKSQGRIINLFGVSAPAGRGNGSMTLLLDDCIGRHAGAGSPYRLFDFEGSRLPGVAKFFSEFGVTWAPFHHIVAERLPAPVRWWKHRRGGPPPS